MRPVTKIAKPKVRVMPGAYNSFVDAARAYSDRERSITVDPGVDLRQATIVQVYNDGGADFEQFDVLGVAGSIFPPPKPPVPPDEPDVAQLLAFQRAVSVRGILPKVEHAGRFVVLLEPVANGRVCRGVLSGVTVARVLINSEDDRFADVQADNDWKYLQSGPSGSTALIWVQPAAERALNEENEPGKVAWCIVRIGGGGSGSPIRRARITGYTSGDEYHYMGQLVDSKGVALKDADGVEIPPQQFWCWKYQPQAESEIWKYFPPIRPNTETDVYPLVVFNPETEKDETRFYVNAKFTFTCSNEGQP